MKSVAFFTGEFGGDLWAILRALRQNLLDIDVLRIITIPNSAAARDNDLNREGIVATLDFSGHLKQKSFHSAFSILKKLAPDLIYLAGFPYLLPSGLIDQFEGRIINAHHSLLPAFPGLFRKEKMISSGVKVVGATIHLVDEGIDTGKILYQAAFPNRALIDKADLLDQYRFVQDAMAIQCLRDLSLDRRTKKDPVIVEDMLFSPGIDEDVLEFIARE